MAIVIVKRHCEKRLEGGHLWLYAGEIGESRGQFENGDLVDVEDWRGNFLGRGFINTTSQIAIRLLTKKWEPIDEQFWLKRIEQAIHYRQQLGLTSDGYRVVYSEGDLLPGLIIDKYGDYLVFQTLTLGMDRHRDTILDICQQLLKPKGIIERNDVSTRRHEGLEQRKGLYRGSLEAPITFQERRLTFALDPINGQKTGFFLDQRENRGLLKGLVEDKLVLDCFCYNGAFAIHAARYGARKVIGIEISKEPLQLAERNATLNRLEKRCQWKEGNAFDALRDYERRGSRFDVVILDPPAFTKGKEAVEGALRGYKEINLRALKILSRGGYLLTSSCSQHVDEQQFKQIVSAAAQDAGRQVRLVQALGQARDHPILLSMPETHYLKCLLMQVIS